MIIILKQIQLSLGKTNLVLLMKKEMLFMVRAIMPMGMETLFMANGTVLMQERHRLMWGKMWLLVLATQLMEMLKTARLSDNLIL